MTKIEAINFASKEYVKAHKSFIRAKQKPHSEAEMEGLSRKMDFYSVVIDLLKENR